MKNNEKNVMNAHGGRLLGDGSFEHPVQMLKWMDLRVSPILYTLFDQCVIFKIYAIALKLMDGIVSPVCNIEGGFLIYE